MSTIVKNIHIFKNGVWRPISKVFHQGEWKKMKGIFYDGVWYEIGSTCVVMPVGCAIATNEHPRWVTHSTANGASTYGTNNFNFGILPSGYVNSENDFDFGSSAFFFTSPDGFGTIHSIWFYYYNDGGINTTGGNGHPVFLSIRLVKPYMGNSPDGTILYNVFTDPDNNKYNGVIIKDKLWLATNYRATTRFYSGGADFEYRYPNNDNSSHPDYGLLYDKDAVYKIHADLVDAGYESWVVSSKEDWEEMFQHLTSTFWCDGKVITLYNYNTQEGGNIGTYLKSCRQVNHPLADMHLHVETEEFIQEVIIYKNDVQVKTIGSSSTSALPIELGDIIKLQILTSRDYITIQDVTARISYGGIVNPGVRTFNMFEAPYHIIIR